MYREIRPAYAEVDLSAVVHNLNQIKRKVGKKVKVMPIVKANAYGHGILEVSKTCVSIGADYIGVGFLEEGIYLRKNGIDCPILVLGGVLGYQIKKFIKYDLDITVSSLELAHNISREVESAKVHLKIDTGMERIGVSYERGADFVKEVLGLGNLEVVGVYSHFATADEKDKTFARLQLDRFRSVLDQLNKDRIRIPLIHMANSGAILDLPDSYFTMVRPGISVYGVYPTDECSRSIQLRSVLSLKSRVVFTKQLPSKTSISYGRHYFTRKKTQIATVPIGYGDGYSRLLTNRGDVLINEKRYPVVGAVCMDQLMVDVGNDFIVVGDEVVLIGKMGAEEITAGEVAGKIGTIPYEVTCMINTRVPRVHINKPW